MTPSSVMTTLAQRTRRLVATAGIAAIYAGAARWSRLFSRRRVGHRSGRILVVGTFDNPNWFYAHIWPLARSGVGTIVLVCDEPVASIGGVQIECAPRWMQVLLTRAGAKLAWSIRCAWRHRPDLYMGYHIFPCSIIALGVARLFGKPACYQVTSGPLELEGGGWGVENRLLRALGGPSPLVAELAADIVREFDSVVVRGAGAAAFVRGLGFDRNLAVITGSVEPKVAWQDFAERSIDIAFVGRLTEYKRPDRFIEVVGAIAKSMPQVRVSIIGSGPDEPALRHRVAELGLTDAVTFLGQRDDVDRLLAKARVYVLTSRWEGVSIAMLEAMAAGAVPVVADVGDLRDVVQVGVTGFLIEQDDIAGYASAVIRLLSDERMWKACSRHARRSALARSGREAIALQWQRHLRDVLHQQPASQAASASGPTP